MDGVSEKKRSPSEMRPADLTGLVNHSQTPRPPLWTQCYQVNTVLASPSLSTMLSNKAPNLEAKMEKGISNNQKGGGGSPLAMAQVCSEEPPSEIHWSFHSFHAQHISSILTVLGEGAPLSGCFRRWLVVRREKADSPLEKGWQSSYLWLL